MGALWAGVGIAAVGAGSSIYGASRSQSQGSYHPAGLALSNLNAYRSAAPYHLNLESNFQPAYGDVFQQNMSRQLFGGQAEQRTVGLQWNARGKVREVTAQMPGSPGILSLMEQAQPRIQGLSQRGRMSDIAAFGPMGQHALQQYDDPRLGAIADYGVNELSRGGQMNPAMAREVEQSVLRGQSARGFGQGNVDIFQQAMNIGQASQQRQQQREGFALASSSEAARANLGRSDFLLNLMGPNQGNAMTAGLLGQAGAYSQASGPKLFQPYGQWAPNAPANSAMANSLAAVGGGLMGIGGAVAKSQFQPNQSTSTNIYNY